MVKTKHIGIEKSSFKEFIDELNNVSSVYEVFATQTHIATDEDIKYNRDTHKAVCFCRDRT